MDPHAWVLTVVSQVPVKTRVQNNKIFNRGRMGVWLRSYRNRTVRTRSEMRANLCMHRVYEHRDLHCARMPSAHRHALPCAHMAAPSLGHSGLRECFLGSSAFR
ncbi:unnamed protein product [Protopolystoma xenopodis]|uniref:Uncharacterized protein n=1 Tax=Protopolystoma xenopodis TaxID=117903 RepID=A0A3S5FDX5_9PLAT|nr:unnamed protein product [Protopolystoma xenopodis]